MRRLTGKYLLRRVASRLLPPAIAHGVKQGFRAPIATLLTGELRPLLLDVLAPDRLRRHGFFRPAEVQRLTEAHLTGRADNARKLWALLCFQIWYDAVLTRATTSERRMPVSTLEPAS
jgi:asparagine synthase (glutamine-hydrolysing)